MRVSSTEETVVQTSAKKADPEHIKSIQIVFGLDQKSFNKTMVVPYENYLRNCDAVRSTAEYQSIVKELTAEKSTSPVVMVVKSQERIQQFRLDEFYDMLNAKPTNLEQVIRSNVNQGKSEDKIEFKQDELINFRNLLETLDLNREAGRQLEAFEDNTVLLSSEKGQLTAGELKRALRINFSSTNPLDDSEKRLIEKIEKVGGGKNIEFPHDNFNKKILMLYKKITKQDLNRLNNFKVFQMHIKLRLKGLYPN